jgi:hypothetical protein
VVKGRFASSLALLASWAALVGCADPVHDDVVRSLGPEDPNVPQGPLHRAGQPCLACHGELGPASSAFSIGGTVYAAAGQTQPALSAAVQIEDVRGNHFTVVTNSAGNFFAARNAFVPRYPIRMSVRSGDGQTIQQMLSLSARNGACADCHLDPASPTSPGHVYVSGGAPVAVGDGGTE